MNDQCKARITYGELLHSFKLEDALAHLSSGAVGSPRIGKCLEITSQQLKNIEKCNLRSCESPYWDNERPRRPRIL